MFQSPNTDSSFVTESGSFFNELIKILLIALVIVVPIRIFIAQPFIVSGSSMDPTFENADYLIIDQLSYRLDDPKRLDVVIFRYPKDTSKFFIKRIIGLPGETVTLTNGQVSILKTDGSVEILDEPYVTHTKRDSTVTTLEDTEYFVLGDNRNASSDSRVWGPLDRDFITGRPFIRLLPIAATGFHPGSLTTQ